MTTTAAYGRLKTSRWIEPRSIAIYGIALGVLACWLALPPIHDAHGRLAHLARTRGCAGRRGGPLARRREGGLGCARRRCARDRPRRFGAPVGRKQPERGLQRVDHRLDARLRDATHLRRARRHVLGAERRREHRPRRDDADGRVLRDLRRRQNRLLVPRDPDRDARRRSDGARPRLLRDPPARRPDRRRDGDQLPGARHHRLPLLPALPRRQHPRRTSRGSPR